ncbi:DUF4083 family protein [Bacillus suaedae]|uniref:DUF4083 family protein n=1 Tax=Halalkalibacter suaedae TaxID=2822140 RepID=A0A940WZD1_9BACI|nr:DUF4083 family protein [Bacillus suaedae]MBP3951555.1 DUF4083 family protein [Bacillus suaedae]
MEVPWGSIIYQIFSFAVILFFIIFIGIAIKRFLNKPSQSTVQNDQLEKKLDRIIELLEKDKK